MILQQVEVLIVSGQETAFESALVEVRRRVFQSPGYRGWTVAQGAEEPTRYLIQVRWETLDELVETTSSGRLERCWEPAEPFLDGPLRVNHWVERPGLDFIGPGTIEDLASF